MEELAKTPVRCLSEAQAARYLGISRSTLRQGRVLGPIIGRMPVPPFVKLGRRVVYLRDDLDQWLEAHRCGASLLEGA
jgi:predicted DNA-binding transcriptional regulator AlpA